MSQAGVYAILNLVTGRCYVGSSVHIPRRWREHLSALNLGNHCNVALQADWTQFGAKSFSWTQVETCSTRDEAIAAEQRHIDATANLYNAARRAGSGPRDGFKHTEERKRHQSKIMKGRPKPEGFGAKVSAWRKGRPNPKHGDALRGRNHSTEHCEKIRLAAIGRVQSEATKAKRAAALKGRDTSAWSWKMAETKTGKPWSVNQWHAFALKNYSV